jgi:protein phosphatase inhibitor 2
LRPTTTPTTAATTAALEARLAHLRIVSPPVANAAVEGRRYASVKSQGAYKLKSKKTIAKKMGAKKTGGMSASEYRMPVWHTAQGFCG